MDNHGLFRVRSQTLPPVLVIGTILLGILAALAPLFFASGATAKVSTATANVPQTRTYYIAADEVEWNYAPTGKNQITGEPFDEDASVFTKQDRTGSAAPTSSPSTGLTPTPPSGPSGSGPPPKSTLASRAR